MIFLFNILMSEVYPKIKKKLKNFLIAQLDYRMLLQFQKQN